MLCQPNCEHVWNDYVNPIVMYMSMSGMMSLIFVSIVSGISVNYAHYQHVYIRTERKYVHVHVHVHACTCIYNVLTTSLASNVIRHVLYIPCEQLYTCTVMYMCIQCTYYVTC